LVDLVEEFVGGLGPGERFGVVVPAVEVGVDGGGEVGNGAKVPRRMACG
jgi:hypothetical protein